MAAGRIEFRAGLVATMPLAPGIAAFGLLYGVMARRVGLSSSETLAMSILVHAGSSQFVALGMWNTSGAWALILTTLVVNLRHLLMGASIAPYLRDLSARWKALLALWMSDESYALAISAFEQGRGSPLHFLGCNLGVGGIWWVSSWLGATIGASLPDPTLYGLDLVFPLAFLGLLQAFLKNRRYVVVALVSGLIALLAARLLPGMWYVMVAGVLGSCVGVVLESKQ